MKFLFALMAHLVIGLGLAWGILLASKGAPGLLIGAALAYLAAFVKLGCLPKSSH